MGALNIYTLVWKNFKIQLRHPWRTAMEILIPIVLTIMLIIIRLTSSIENKEIETIFLSYIIDSLPPKYNTTNAWYLYYTPQTPFLEQVMEEVASYLNVTITGLFLLLSCLEIFVMQSYMCVYDTHFRKKILKWKRS